MSEEAKDWKDLQVKVAELYKSLGCITDVNVPVKGIRTKHKIDVLAIFKFGGLEYRIIIECKYWNTNVNKAQVGTLLGILADIGAEKGIIVSKKGFQPGAHRLASYTNIDLFTFCELTEKSQIDIEHFKIHYVLDRIQKLSTPFNKFAWKMTEEAERKELVWTPSESGNSFRGVLYMLRTHVENIDVKTFPRRYIYSYIIYKIDKKIVSKVVKNRREYLDCILDNLEILEQEYKKYKKEIFSE